MCVIAVNRCWNVRSKRIGRPGKWSIDRSIETCHVRKIRFVCEIFVSIESWTRHFSSWTLLEHIFHFDRASWIYAFVNTFLRKRFPFDIRNVLRENITREKKRKKPEHPLSFLYFWRVYCVSVTRYTSRVTRFIQAEKKKKKCPLSFQNPSNFL